MNILYCGDQNIEDGLMISVLSLLKNVSEPLQIYVLTLTLPEGPHPCSPVRDEVIEALDTKVKEAFADAFVQKLDVTKLFQKEMPSENLDTRFTPCCMLRLYADEIPELPDRLLYLDNDVVCRGDLAAFYHQNLDNVELVGVLDYYGSWFFRNKFWKRDYVNSGVLLLNLAKIRETGLFGKCRVRCRTKKMFMPDQSAINKLAVGKRLADRKYNEQRILREDTVLQHFTTSFRFFPWVRTVTVKPWQIDRMHDILKLREYDALLEEYLQFKAEV